MRLINTATIELKEFIGTNVPPYVILSHTWEDGEVLYGDLQNRTASSKPNGYAKLLGCCKKAREDGYDWAWIDTCCIDKSSSAELSEAINSMFAWYRDADICYAYLQDVSNILPGSDILSIKFPKFQSRVKILDDYLKSITETGKKPPTHGYEHFLKTVLARADTAKLVPYDYCLSKWFTRGWTLQELIAPRAVEFYTAEWEEIGTKAALAAEISATTGIPVRILRGGKLSSCNVAERLSWASARKTTRVEDMAYSLLDLFGINMPLLYGEGVKSFVRLQQHIMEQKEDYSILAWTLQYDCHDSLTGCLASSPSEFSRTAPKSLHTPIWMDSQSADEPVPEFKQHAIKDLPGQYLCAKNYHQLCRSDLERVRKTHPGQRSEYNPPQLTSRGLRISLLMRPLGVGKQSEEEAWMAWTYYELKGQLVCIILDRSLSSPDLFGRRFAPWLAGIDRSLLDEFKPRDIFLYPNGHLAGIDPGPAYIQPTLVPARGRLRIATSFKGAHPTYSMSAHPATSWSLDEFFFPGTPEVIGIAVFETAYSAPLPSKDRRSSRFEVACGFHGDRIWCSISEALRSWDGMGSAELASAFKETQAQRDEAFEDLTDRAVRRSTRMPGTIIAARVRQRSTAQAHGVAYVVEVSVSEEDRCEGWAHLCVVAQNVARLQRQAEAVA